MVHIGGSSSSKPMVYLLSAYASIFLAKPSSSTSLKKLHRELLGAFSFSLVAQGRCSASDFSLLRFLSDNDSRFFFETRVSSSPSHASRPKGAFDQSLTTTTTSTNLLGHSSFVSLLVG